MYIYLISDTKLLFTCQINCKITQKNIKIVHYNILFTTTKNQLTQSKF